jgi:hypothetical protein
MDMKQTAVEWLIEELKENNLLTFDEWKELFQQAKEMEKEQIIQAFENGELCTLFKNEDTSIKYYNQTFKSE